MILFSHPTESRSTPPLLHALLQRHSLGTICRVNQQPPDRDQMAALEERASRGSPGLRDRDEYAAGGEPRRALRGNQVRRTKSELRLARLRCSVALRAVQRSAHCRRCGNWRPFSCPEICPEVSISQPIQRHSAEPKRQQLLQNNLQMTDFNPKVVGDPHRRHGESVVRARPRPLPVDGSPSSLPAGTADERYVAEAQARNKHARSRKHSSGYAPSPRTLAHSARVPFRRFEAASGPLWQASFSRHTRWDFSLLFDRE